MRKDEIYETLEKIDFQSFIKQIEFDFKETFSIPVDELRLLTEDENMLKIIIFYSCKNVGRIPHHNYFKKVIENRIQENMTAEKLFNNLFDYDNKNISKNVNKVRDREEKFWLQYTSLENSMYLILGVLRSSFNFRYIVASVENYEVFLSKNHKLDKCFDTYYFDDLAEAMQFYNQQFLNYNHK